MALDQIGRQPHGSTTNEDMMGPPIDDQFDVQTTADQLAAMRAELRNAQALANKLQALLDSKAHQVDALHAEAESALRALDLAAGARDQWHARYEEANSIIDGLMEVLRPHAPPAFTFSWTPLDAARYVASRLTADPVPDIDTVPLADLLEAIGTYLEHDQAVTIRGSIEPVRQVDIHAMGLTFRVSTHDTSEALTHAHELAQSQLVQGGSQYGCNCK